MRILLLSDEFPPDGSGGDAQVVANLARQYKLLGHEVSLIVATKSMSNDGYDRWEGIPIRRIYAEYHPRWQAWLSLWNPTAVRTIKRALSEFKPDIVHAHGVNRYLSYQALIEARKGGAKVFLTAHDAMLYHFGKAPNESRISSWNQLRTYKFSYSPFRNLFITHALKAVSAVIAVSSSLKRALANNGVSVKAVIRNGIDCRDWEVSKEEIAEFKRKNNLSEDVILFGGRLSGLKGAFIAVEVLAALHKERASVQLCVIGSKNDIAEEMRVMAKQYGVENRLIFTGRIADNDLRAAYHSASLVLVPSLYLDPFPTIILEAFACSKPVIATKFGGASELVDDNKSGFVVDPNDVSLVAEKIMVLLKDKSLSERMGRQGLKRVLTEFTLERQAAAYIDMFER